MSRVHLVRHAHAGERCGWPGDDLDRPLSDVGRQQASGIADALAARATALMTSSAVRCRQTLAPIEDRTGLHAVDEPLLLEGADPAATLDWLVRLPDGAIACSHGDVIGGIIRLLATSGPADETAGWPKAGWWTLETAQGRVTSATPHPPPS